MSNAEGLVCVLCGEPWEPAVKNRCECGGFCTWGEAKDGPPSSWDVSVDGGWTPKPPPADVIARVEGLSVEFEHHRAAFMDAAVDTIRRVGGPRGWRRWFQ